MDVELGIRDVARAVTFSTDESAQAVNDAIAAAVAEGRPFTLTDSKGRTIIVPAGALGYAIVGSETKHAVGFGAI